MKKKHQAFNYATFIKFRNWCPNPAAWLLRGYCVASPKGNGYYAQHLNSCRKTALYIAKQS